MEIGESRVAVRRTASVGARDADYRLHLVNQKTTMPMPMQAQRRR